MPAMHAMLPLACTLLLKGRVNPNKCLLYTTREYERSFLLPHLTEVPAGAVTSGEFESVSAATKLCISAQVGGQSRTLATYIYQLRFVLLTGTTM